MNLTALSAGAILILALGNLFFLNRWQGARDDLTRYQSAVAQAQKQAEDVARLRAEREQRILEDTARGWSHAVDWHRAHPRIVRVQQPAGACLKPVPALSATAGIHAQLPAGGSEGRTLSVEQCEQLANDSLLDAEWIEAVKRRDDKLSRASP